MLQENEFGLFITENTNDRIKFDFMNCINWKLNAILMFGGLENLSLSHFCMYYEVRRDRISCHLVSYLVYV